MDSAGKLVMESILETEAATILQFFAGLRGSLWVTFEEGTWSAWLYDLLNLHVYKLVVCNPRKNALLRDGNKRDRIDARKLAELLRGNQLKPVYHGETGVRMLRELSRSYLTIVKDLSRVMNRLKAVYRSLPQLDMLQYLRQQARRELLAESRKHAITAKLRQIPYLGPIRSALATPTSYPNVQDLLLVSFQQIVVWDDEQIQHRQLGLARGSHGPVCAVRSFGTKRSAVDYFRCSASPLADGLRHFLLQAGPIWPSTIPLLFSVRDVLVCDYDPACGGSSSFD
jgi:hypothetical protein